MIDDRRISGTEAVHITSGTTYNNTISNSIWNASQTYPVTGLSYGTYTISADAISGYNAVVNPVLGFFLG